MTDTRLDEFVLKLGGERYLVAEDRNGVRQFRSNVVSTQGPIPLDEQAYPLADFSEGSGYSYERPGLGVYEQADGFDATSPGNLATWPRLAVGESFTTADAPSDILQVGLYMYVGRGRFVEKYALDDTVGSTWSILETHDLGSGNTLAGRPVLFQGKGYFPIRTGTTGSLQRFHELDTTNATVVETQTIVISGTPTSGTYTVTFDGKTTGNIAFNADGATVQAALRLVAGLERVTVVTTGTIPNFTHTVTMTGAAGALGTTSPPQMTSTDSMSGGTHAIAHNTTVAGTTDRWDLADATLAFSCFCVWKEQLRGAIGNKVYSCAVTPTTAANWNPAIGSGYEVGDSGQDITELCTYPQPDLLVVLKTDGIWTFTEGLQTRNEVPTIRPVIDSRNGRYASLANAYVLVPHASGLIRWRPGAYQYVGPEQDGTLEGLLGHGWGRAAGVATYNRKTYVALNDAYHGEGSLVSLDEPRPGQQRYPLVPHTHHRVSGSMEAVAIVSTQQQPTAPRTPTSFSDDNAVGTITWSNTSNAGALDGVFATAAAGTSHYLKALNPSNAIPTDATVLGVLVEVAKKVGTSTTFSATQIGTAFNRGLASYALARETTPANGSGTTSLFVGQGYDGTGTGNDDQVAQGFLDFDTSSIPDTATITSVALTMDVIGNGDVETWTMQARLHDFGGSITAADFVAGSGLSAKTLLATYDMTGVGLGSITMAESGTAFRTNINKTGNTRIILCSNLQVAGIAPSTSVFGIYDVLNNATLTVTFSSGTVDNVAKLVVGGSVVGSNLADTVTTWPSAVAYTSYGGATNLWGTGGITAAQANGSTFGFVFSATVASGETASIDHIRMTTYYSVPGASDPSTFVAVVVVDPTRTIATPYIYKEPRAGLTVANDPNINRQVDDATFDSARLFAPSRNVKKVWRSFESWFDISPETNTPGVQIWATVDDGDAFQLRDEDGATKTVTTTGRHRFFFPSTSVSIGHYLQLQVRIPAATGGQVGVALNMRESRLYVALMPSRAERCEMTVVLGDGEFEDGMSMRRTVAQQRSDLAALADPAAAPITFHDPVARRDGYLRVEGVSFSEGMFKGFDHPVQVAALTIFKALYDDAT